MEPPHGTELVKGAVYEFHKPGFGHRMEVEIVFMHGLQLSSNALKRAYFETWTTRDGREVWPETWLRAKYPHARILSLAYDSSARKKRKVGNTRPSMLGESLLEQMVLPEAYIGQHGCPVVFVCHSLGGLIAKEIVVKCDKARDNVGYRNLLQNIRAFFFYATPHGGSGLAGLAKLDLRYEPSSLVEYLKRNETTRSEVHAQFVDVLEGFKKKCKIFVVAEGQETEALGFSKWVVRENSARYPGPSDSFLLLNYADHKTVCKPQNPQDTGYLKLTSCISQVIQEHFSSVSVHLPVEPIGIDDKIAEVCERMERSQVSVVGLFGMGGVGKTTLSKKVYNLKARDYAKSCYLEEVKSKKVVDVQKQLLRELCAENLGQGEGVGTHHLDKIKECFATERVLVVFDDVPSRGREYLEASQVFRAFEPGSHSKVIVTGRDRGILSKNEKSDKASIVSIDGIRDEEGSDMQLFAHHAFRSVDEGVRERVKARFQDLANDIVKLCNGLPLSLEVIGAYLGTEYNGDDEEDLCGWTGLWTDAYEKLRTAQSLDGNADDRLWSSLRVSYDSLAPRERAMFLDFACIFSRYTYDSDEIKRIWDSESGVQNLLNKSLLREDKRYGWNVFVIHDQLRDMGRYLLLKEAVKDRPIYLMEKRFLNLEREQELKGCNDTGVPLVAGLEQWRGSQFHSYYSKLRFLTVGKCCEASLLDDCLSECSRELRWLYLGSSKFTNRSMQKLGSFEGLRVLQILDCHDLVELSFDFDKLVNLVELKLDKCWDLRSLPSSIGKLKRLKVLWVELCPSIQSIPPEVGDLFELEELSFRGCYGIKSSQDLQLGCVDRLKVLKLPFILITCLPPCPHLRELCFQREEGVGQFPRDFFKVHMPNLYCVQLEMDWGRKARKVVLYNPDGSTLEVGEEKVGRDGSTLEVEEEKVRDMVVNVIVLDVIKDLDDGSIQKLQILPFVSTKASFSLMRASLYRLTSTYLNRLLANCP